MLFISFVSRSTLVKYRPPYEELGTQICLTDMQLREASLGRLLDISAASDFLLSICFICMGYGGQGHWTGTDGVFSSM